MEKIKNIIGSFKEQNIYLRKLKGIYCLNQNGIEFNPNIDKIILSKEELNKIEKLCYLDGLIGFNASKKEIAEIKKIYKQNSNLGFLEIYNLLEKNLSLNIFSNSKCFKTNKMCCYAYKNFISNKILKEIKNNYQYSFIFIDNKIDLFETKILNVDFSDIIKIEQIDNFSKYIYIELMPDFLAKEKNQIEVEFKDIKKIKNKISVDFKEKSTENNIIRTIYKYNSFIIEKP